MLRSRTPYPARHWLPIVARGWDSSAPCSSAGYDVRELFQLLALWACDKWVTKLHIFFTVLIRWRDVHPYWYMRLSLPPICRRLKEQDSFTTCWSWTHTYTSHTVSSYPYLSSIVPLVSSSVCRWWSPWAATMLRIISSQCVGVPGFGFCSSLSVSKIMWIRILGVWLGSGQSGAYYCHVTTIPTSEMMKAMPDKIAEIAK